MPRNDWTPIALDGGLYQNLDEETIKQGFSALENAYVNEAGGISRFPGLTPFVTYPNDSGRFFINEWRGDLIGVSTSGRVYRVDYNGQSENVTGVPVSGGRRVIFADTPNELTMVAGGAIVAFRGTPGKTVILSEDAPKATFIQFVDDFLVANEVDSGRFQHCRSGLFDQWDPLDTFSANGNPDNIDALLVTRFQELLIAGLHSIEQFERLATGAVPFFKRWNIGEGLGSPYAMMFADNAVVALNENFEVVRMSGQTAQPIGQEIGRVLEKITDWRDAWIGGYPDSPYNAFGQKFLILQIPYAENSYGTQGITFGYDYRARKWFSLYGWDNEIGIPTRWPGWSHWRVKPWNRLFVGGEGVIYEVTDSSFWHGTAPARMVLRTGHIPTGTARINNLRMTVKRGVGSNTTAGKIRLRVNRDARGFGRWKEKSLGQAGNRDQALYFGSFSRANTFQFEIEVFDDSPVEIKMLEAHLLPAE